MRVASYNIFEGARDTYSLLKTFVAQQNIDVLCLQEANGWQDGSPSRIEDFAVSTGLRHAVYGDSNTPCKVLTFSRVPIRSSRLHREGFWHCAVQTKLRAYGQTFELWNTHLNPFDEDKRLREAAYIARLAHNAIIVGDMNSLSAEDTYDVSLVRTFQKLGNKRYGDGELRHDVTEYFMRHGFIDAAVETGDNENTFPARTDCEPDPQTMRLDYMFASHSLAETIQRVEVVKNDLTDQISDHYPLVSTISLRVPMLAAALHGLAQPPAEVLQAA